MLEEQRTYSISEAAEILTVSKDWLRFGERLGSLPPARRSPGGHRRYTKEDIVSLRQLGVGESKRRVKGGHE